MAKRDEGRSNWEDAYCRRLAQLRKDAGFNTPDAMAKAVGIPIARYKKYESRTPLPPWLIPRVCVALDIPVWFFLTGRMTQEKAPPPEPPPEKAVTPLRPKRVARR